MVPLLLILIIVLKLMVSLFRLLTAIGIGVTNVDSDDSDDIHDKRMSFIGQVNSVLCFFNYLYSSTKQKLFHIYCSSFLVVSYGLLLTPILVIFVLLGIRLLDISGFYQIGHTVLYYHCLLVAYLFMI